MKLAVLRVSPDLLIELLHLPEGTEILDCSCEGDFNRLDILLKIGAEDLRDVGKGESIPEVSATLSKSAEGQITFNGWYYP